ncbi:hypothetical protein D3C81_530110 [compost metagenome]
MNEALLGTPLEPEPPSPSLPSLAQSPPPMQPAAQATMDGLAGLQFKQTKHQRNKPRSVWPKIFLGAMVFGIGYVGYMNYPAILAKIAGKPSTAEIERLLVEPLAGSLKVNDFKVPAKFVEIPEVHVRNVETFDKRDGVVFYRATGDAVARLTASGAVIGKDVEGQIGGNARRLNYRSAIEAVYSRFQAHSAMADVPAGTQYPLGFEVVVRVVDGNAVLVDGRISSNN